MSFWASFRLRANKPLFSQDTSNRRSRRAAFSVSFKVKGNSFRTGIKPMTGELATDSNNFCPQLIWHGLRMSMRGTGFRRDGLRATSIKSVEDLIDALPGNTKVFSYL